MKCKICNIEESDPNRFCKSEERDLMESDGLCFSCAFWENHARDFEEGKDKGKVFIVKGNRYFDGGEVDKRTARGFLGYGGADWKIRMLESGEITETNNLWHQGDIPEHFRGRMPDNAEFIH